MKESPLDKDGNRNGYRVVTDKCDTGRIGANGALLCDRLDETLDEAGSGVPFPQRVVTGGGAYTFIDNYECMKVSGFTARRHRRHLIYFIGGRPQFRRVWSYVNGVAR